MLCNNCGNQLKDNACICEKCGSFCGGNTCPCSKKEYFASGRCSAKSKKLMPFAWVLAVLISLLLIYNLISVGMSVPKIIADIDQCESYEDIITTFNKVAGADIGITVADMESQYGDDVEACKGEFRAIAYGIVGVSGVMYLATVILTVLAVYKKGSRQAVWAMVLCCLSASQLIVWLASVSVFIIVRGWDKEYRVYCLNPSAYDSTTNYDFT